MKLIGFLLGLFVSIAYAENKPTVASMNLCTDRLVLALADPQQIASLSYVAVDPYSMIKTATESISLNHGQLEEMLQFGVDYILASEFDNPWVLERLQQYGKTVRKFQAAHTIEDAKNNIQIMSELLDQTERGNLMISKLETINQLNKIQNNPRTLMLGANNYISGNNSLASDLVEILGYNNIADEAKVSDYGQISLEQVIDLRPEVIILNQYSTDYSKAQAVLQHPLLKHLSQQIKIYTVPTREWICGDDALVNAARRLH